MPRPVSARGRQRLITVAALTALAVLGVVAPSPATAVESAPAVLSEYDTASEATFVDALNDIRSNLGLGALSVDDELTAASRSWTDEMADAGAISHAPSIAAGVTQNWSKVGENVGKGPSVAALVEAFIASSSHYENLTDPLFTRVGVGVVWANGTMYTTHRFMALHGSPAPTPEPVPEPLPATDPSPQAPASPDPAVPETTAPQAPPTPATTAPTPPAPSPPPAQAENIQLMLDALIAVTR